jgi:hypothetical protein
MGNNTSQLIIAVEDNAVRTRGTTAVDLSGAQDRPLIVGAGDREVEALVVVVPVGVVVAADGLVRGVQLITGFLSGAHGARAIAVAAAGVVAGAGVEFSRGGQDRGEQQGCDGDDLVVLLGWWNAYRGRGVGCVSGTYLVVQHLDRRGSGGSSEDLI